MGARKLSDLDLLRDLAGKAGYCVERLAVLCECSPRHLRRVLRDSYGCSPQILLEVFRFRKAQERLLSRAPVKEVAFDLGYKHASSFCHWFRGICGLSPSEFLLLCRAEA